MSSGVWSARKISGTCKTTTFFLLLSTRPIPYAKGGRIDNSSLGRLLNVMYPSIHARLPPQSGNRSALLALALALLKLVVLAPRPRPNVTTPSAADVAQERTFLAYALTLSQSGMTCQMPSPLLLLLRTHRAYFPPSWTPTPLVTSLNHLGYRKWRHWQSLPRLMPLQPCTQVPSSPCRLLCRILTSLPRSYVARNPGFSQLPLNQPVHWRNGPWQIQNGPGLLQSV